MSRVSHIADLIIKGHSTKINPYLLDIFVVGEYTSYLMAFITIMIGFAFSAKNLFYFFKGNEHELSQIIKMRLNIGHVVNLSLTYIMAGHVIRLIYSTHISTIIFLLIIVAVRELMTYLIDNEIKELYRAYQFHINYEKSKQS